MSLVANDSCVEPRFAPMSQSDDWIIRQAIALLEQRVFKKGPSLERPAAVKDYLRLKLAAEPNEVFAIVFLNSMHEVLAYEPMPEREAGPKLEGEPEELAFDPSILLRPAWKEYWMRLRKVPSLLGTAVSDSGHVGSLRVAAGAAPPRSGLPLPGLRARVRGRASRGALDRRR